MTEKRPHPHHLLHPHASLSHITWSLCDQTTAGLSSCVCAVRGTLQSAHRLSDNGMEMRWKKGRGADSSQGKIHTVIENNVLFVSHGSKATKKAKQDQNNFPHHLLLSCGAKSLGTYTRKMLTQKATKSPPFETGQGSLPFTPKFKILCKPCTWYQPHR